MFDCQIGMNDYRLIGAMDTDDMNYFNRHESRTVTANFLLNEHKNSVSYIREQLKRDNKRTIIMTHHAPTNVSLNKQHVGNGLDGAYASNLSDLILGHPQIQYWVHGHTHMNVEYSVGDFCHVVSNQRGYNHEPCYRQFGGVKTLKKKDV
jgi:Icc-related predicted phosphoesterase